MQKNRRRHKMYVTRNSEYHFRDDECVGVRDRRTGKWKRWHRAVRGRLMGFMDRNNVRYEAPIRGGRLHLVSKHIHILTSPLMLIDRPPKMAPPWYISHCWNGEIVTNLAA